MNLSKQLIFFKNLHKAVSSGLPSGDFFSRLARNSKQQEKILYNQLSKDIENGSSIAKSISKHKGLINELYISLINIGEKSGKLDEIINNIISIIEGRIYLRKKIFTELKQPIINIGGGLLIFLIVIFVLIPALMGFLNGSSVSVPPIISIVFYIQQFLAKPESWLLMLLVIIGITAVDFYVSEIEDIAEYLGHKTIKLPLIGNITRWFNLYIYFLVLKSCYSAGLSFIESTEFANTTIKNNYIKKFTGEIHEKTKEGNSISAILGEYSLSGIFEQEIPQIIEIGESTGKTEEAFNDVVNLLKDQMESKFETICKVTQVLGFILAATPIVFIAGIVLSIIQKAAETVMHAVQSVNQ